MKLYFSISRAMKIPLGAKDYPFPVFRLNKVSLLYKRE